MMHEDWFGGNLSAGTRAVLDVCRKDAPDFSVLFHGGDNCTSHMLAPDYGSLKAKKEVYELGLVVRDECEKAGVRYRSVDIPSGEDRAESPVSFNLASAMHHCCSEPAVTFESNQGLTDRGDIIYTHEEIYKVHAIYIREVMRYVLKKHNKL